MSTFPGGNALRETGNRRFLPRLFMRIQLEHHSPRGMPLGAREMGCSPYLLLYSPQGKGLYSWGTRSKGLDHRFADLYSMHILQVGRVLNGLRAGREDGLIDNRYTLPGETEAGSGSPGFDRLFPGGIYLGWLHGRRALEAGGRRREHRYLAGRTLYLRGCPSRVVREGPEPRTLEELKDGARQSVKSRRLWASPTA